MNATERNYLFGIICALLVLAIAAAIAGYIAISDGSVLYQEASVDDTLDVSYLYLNGNRTYVITIEEPRLCTIDFTTKSGSAFVEILDADGSYIYDDGFTQGYRGYEFTATGDITINIYAKDLRGSFTFRSSEPISPPA